MLQSLQQALEKLNRTHRELVQIADAKREVLIKGDINKLSELIKKEAELIREIVRLEQDRIESIEKMCVQEGLANAQMTLQQILNAWPAQDEAKYVQQVATDLQNTLLQLREKNDLNKQLTEDSLDFVNHSIELMTDLQVSPTYDRPQQENKKPQDRQRFFDAKA